MVKKSETNVERLFQEALRDRIGEQRYSMWFAAGVRFVFSSAGLTVRVETSEFLCNWIRSTFKHILEQLGADFFGRPTPIEILYVGQKTSDASSFVANDPAESVPADQPKSNEISSKNATSNLFENVSANESAFSSESFATAPVKKRRGRPPKNQAANIAANKANIAANNSVSATSATFSPIDVSSSLLFDVETSGSTAKSESSADVFAASTPLNSTNPEPPRRRRGRPRKTPEPISADSNDLNDLKNSKDSAQPAVAIRNAFELAFSKNANSSHAVSSNFGAKLDAESAPWNLSDAERDVWAAGAFHEVRSNGSGSNEVAPGVVAKKRGRPPKAAPPALFDDETVSRDKNGANFVKKPTPQNRAAQLENGSAPRWASLSSFVEGFSNRLARKVVDVALVEPGAMNPIFIYGPTSVGKTHLLEGVCAEYRRFTNRKPALCMTSEEFTTAFIQSLRGGAPFRERFKNISLFALDDVHFLEGKTTTQTELLNIVDFLRARRVQMIFAANRSLSELTKLRGELTTRIESGVVCKIENPERETLSLIFQQMAIERRLVVSDDVCRFVVSRFATHARQLSGVLNRLYAAHLTTGAPIDVELAREALADLLASNVRSVKLEDVERVVQELFGLDGATLKSKSRSKRCADPRALAMWLARKHTRSALAEIGAYFGGRRHSAVVSAQKKVERWLAANEPLESGDSVLTVGDAIDRMERELARPRL